MSDETPIADLDPVLDETEAEARYRAPALDKGLDILELLSECSGGLTKAEIVKAMGRRSQSEIYRMLERLVARDYVARSPQGDRYALSLKLFMLAHRHPPLRRLVAQAAPLMDAFAQSARQSCHLVLPDRGAATIAALALPMADWSFSVRVGGRVELLTTGSGRTMLAFLAPERRDAILALWGATVSAEDWAAMEPELSEIRRLGWRTGDSRQIVGVRDLTAPILGPDGDAVAALTCPYVRRLDAYRGLEEAETLAALLDLARRLSYG